MYFEFVISLGVVAQGFCINSNWPGFADEREKAADGHFAKNELNISYNTNAMKYLIFKRRAKYCLERYLDKKC